MVEYTKPWLSLEQQVEQLAHRGVDVGDQGRAVALLKSVGYYRLTGYLYLSIEAEAGWHQRLVALMQTFPTSHALSTGSIGFPRGWESLALWRA